MTILEHTIHPEPAEPDLERLILVVVGAHLRAEIRDRPAAARLRDAMLGWLKDSHPDDALPHRIVLVTDLWYLNQDELRALPTVSVGGPTVNALTAFLGDKLPSAFSIDDVLLVQMDLEYEDLLASCWGTDGVSTEAAVDAFLDRYLNGFMTEATRDWA